METDFRAINQKEIEFELKVRMTLADWETLGDQLTDVPNVPYPAWHLRGAIREMVRKANQHWVGPKDE